MAYLLCLLGEWNKRNGRAHSLECKRQVGSWISKSIDQRRGMNWKHSVGVFSVQMLIYQNTLINLVIGSEIHTIHQVINLQWKIYFSYTWKVPSPYLGKLLTDPSIICLKIRLMVGNCFNTYFTFTFHFCALEKEMATYSSVLAWWIPGTPGALTGDTT